MQLNCPVDTCLRLSGFFLCTICLPFVQVAVRVIGVDLKTIVQGRELVSIQLMETSVKVDMAPDPPPQDQCNNMSVKLEITNINILDLQARTILSSPNYLSHWQGILSAAFPDLCFHIFWALDLKER